MRRRGFLLVAAALAVALALPAVAPVYHTTLMLPFMAYAIALLGLNLLFGYAGLVSFGHALFLGVGAYTGAALTAHTPVRSLELILVAAGVAGAAVAVPVGALCVRYAQIYFGMLTLAFGMLFYTFVLKFYGLTGGDEGMRFLRPTLLGQPLAGWPKMAYLAGPYYYYSLALLVLAAAAMWRVVHSPFGLCLRTVRDNPLKAESLGLSVPRYRWCAFVISAVYAAVGGVLLAIPTGNVDPTLVYWTHSGNLVFMTLFQDEDGSRRPLPQKNVDTGAGLERWAPVYMWQNGVDWQGNPKRWQTPPTIYDTDLFRPIIARIEELTGIGYDGATDEQRRAMRVVAEHTRSAAFLIADGHVHTGRPDLHGPGDLAAALRLDRRAPLAAGREQVRERRRLGGYAARKQSSA